MKKLNQEQINNQIKRAYDDFYENLEIEVDYQDQIQSAIDTTTPDEFIGEDEESVYNYFLGELNLYKNEILERLS